MGQKNRGTGDTRRTEQTGWDVFMENYLRLIEIMSRSGWVGNASFTQRLPAQDCTVRQVDRKRPVPRRSRDGPVPCTLFEMCINEGQPSGRISGG